MILYIVIGLLTLLSIILGFTTFNLLKKQEKAEDILIEYMTYLDNLSRIVEVSDKKIREIDHKQSFESDDEIGFFFKSIKQIQEILNEFKVIRITNDSN
jgi:hypothetical protein